MKTSLPAIAVLRRIIPLLLLLATLGSCRLPVPDAAPVPGFTVREGRLRDATGTDFIMRGINLPHAWYRGHSHRALADVAATGANTVRLVLATGDQWRRTSAGELRRLLDRCRELHLIAVVEVHDCTGYGDMPAAAPLAHAVDYWLELQPVLSGREDTVILNIANEPFGNAAPEGAWFDGHRQAIATLRAAGFTHTLMIDAANWGQDWRRETLRRAPDLFATDPLQNLVFSVHMYEVFAEPETVRSYLADFVARGMPLVVGEFAQDHKPGEKVAAPTILEECERLGLGYLGWSWSGNGGELSPLDIVTHFDPARPTPWGRLLLDSPAGIRATARTAAVFLPSPTHGEPSENALPAAAPLP